LGLNDALVEITGTLAGLSFALRVSQTVGIAGLITGVAASLSMAASEYLSQVADGSLTNEGCHLHFNCLLRGGIGSCATVLLYR